MVFWKFLCILWILYRSRVVIPRLKYNYFADISKYDRGLLEKYNDDINTSSNPNSLIYNFNTDDDKRQVNKFNLIQPVFGSFKKKSDKDEHKQYQNCENTTCAKFVSHVKL